MPTRHERGNDDSGAPRRRQGQSWCFGAIPHGRLSFLPSLKPDISPGGACEHRNSQFAEVLLSNLQSPMQRFMQLANLNVGGVWLDTGSDDKEQSIVRAI